MKQPIAALSSQTAAVPSPSYWESQKPKVDAPPLVPVNSNTPSL